MLENTEGAIKNEQSRETGNVGHQGTQQEEKQHNICWTYYTQTNTNNVNKT